MHVSYTCIHCVCKEGVSSIPSLRYSVLEWFSMLLLVWLWAAGPNYSGACGMSYCALPVYFRAGSVCRNTQAKQEKRGREGTKAPILRGHRSKIELVKWKSGELRGGVPGLQKRKGLSEVFQHVGGEYVSYFNFWSVTALLLVFTNIQGINSEVRFLLAESWKLVFATRKKAHNVLSFVYTPVAGAAVVYRVNVETIVKEIMETCHILFVEAESLRYLVFSLTHFDFIMFYILPGWVLIVFFSSECDYLSLLSSVWITTAPCCSPCRCDS